MDSTLPQIDISHILELREADFLRQLYELALKRPPDSEGLRAFQSALRTGMSREAVAYLIFTSPEFAGRAPVAQFARYKNAYEKYRWRQFQRRIPLIRWFSNLSEGVETLRNRLFAIDAEVEALTATLDQRMDSLSTLTQTLNGRLDTSNGRLDALNGRLDQRLGALESSLVRSRPAFYGFQDGITVIRLQDYTFGVPSEEWRLAVYLDTYGYFELGTERYFRSILKEGMNVVDVGANLGIYTLHALAAGCRAFAYEPTPRIFSILLDNIGINGFEPSGRATPYNLAVSDTEGEVKFAVYNKVSGHNSFYAASSNDQTITVKTICLDHHLGHLTHVDVVKIDVEGAEPLVLRGMQEIIEKNPAIKIIMEFAPSVLKRGDHDPLAFLRVIHGMGLSTTLIQEATGELQNTSDAELCEIYSANLLLTKLS